MQPIVREGGYTGQCNAQVKGKNHILAFLGKDNMLPVRGLGVEGKASHKSINQRYTSKRYRSSPKRQGQRPGR